MTTRAKPDGKRKNDVMLVSYRISKQTIQRAAMISKRWGWNKRTTIERALAFAASHPDFSPLTSDPEAAK
jgi:hypothetical protein